LPLSAAARLPAYLHAESPEPDAGSSLFFVPSCFAVFPFAGFRGSKISCFSRPMVFLLLPESRGSPACSCSYVFAGIFAAGQIQADLWAAALSGSSWYFINWLFSELFGV